MTRTPTASNIATSTMLKQRSMARVSVLYMHREIEDTSIGTGAKVVTSANA